MGRGPAWTEGLDVGGVLEAAISNFVEVVPTPETPALNALLASGASFGSRWIDLDGNVCDGPLPSDSVAVKHGESSQELILDVIVGGVSERLRLKNAPAIGGMLFEAIRLLDARTRMADQARAQAEAEAVRLGELLAQSLNREFGTSSEKSPPAASDDGVKQVDPGLPLTQADEEAIAPSPKPRRPSANAGRKPIDASWPRVDVVVDEGQPPPACTSCNSATVFLRYDETERATVIPKHFRVIRTKRPLYVCRCCGKHTAAAVEPSFLPGSSYGSPELIADIAVSKYRFGLPLYRYAEQATSHGVSLSRATAANLIIAASERLTPLGELFRETLLKQSALHIDETVLQVLNEPGRPAEATSYLWCFQSVKGASPQVVDFRYRTTRSGSNAVAYLTHDDGTPWTGTMQVDGYAGYNKVENVTRIACMAHIRRKFIAVMQLLPKHQQAQSVAGQVVAKINKLYLIEREGALLTGDSLRRHRQRHSRPITDEIKVRLLEHRSSTLKNSGLGRAIAYALDQWPHMERYIDEPQAAIDNNRVERAIKRVVLGRNAWLFCESQDGAHATALMYSIVETCLANKVDPYKYLVWVMKRLPHAKTAADVRLLLPWCMPSDSEAVPLPSPIAA